MPQRAHTGIIDPGHDLPPFADFLEAPPTLAFRADKKKARAKSDLYEMVEVIRIELTTF